MPHEVAVPAVRLVLDSSAYHNPVDGRNTVISVFPSPSKSPALLSVTNAAGIATRWPSGLVIVSACRSSDAPTVERFKVTDVGESYLTAFTVMPPSTVAVSRHAKPGPGS